MKTPLVIVLQLLLILSLSAQFDYPEAKPKADQELQADIIGKWKHSDKSGYSRQLIFSNNGVFTDTVRTKDGSVKTDKGLYHIRNGELTMDYTKGKGKEKLKYLFIDDEFMIEGDTLWLSKNFGVGGDKFLKFKRMRIQNG
ncbi:hypothetical protein HW115_18855 [Verrucomicrobiaceae bacterium N1E253]|uniref:Uncharacterized protein n=1 Tax=Oceaniferula marina TaxID=2748318 RepID=A0A851GRD6_9BACT|nr:hypothetical protein [Oceaniferula marina]NWK57685.1 hypothetical protein [Oceaniferula marina]